MHDCARCGSSVGDAFRYCPWCATPQRLKLVEFFRARRSETSRALRVSRYLHDDLEERHVRFSIWDDAPWTPTAWSQALDLGEIQFVSDWNGDAVRGFGIAHEFRGMKDVAQRTAFLVEPGGTVRGAWLYDTGEVPDFDELLAAVRAL